MELYINYFAVVGAALAAMVIGSLWYSPQVGFGKMWMKLMGWGKDVPESAKKSIGKSYAIMFATALVTAFVLAHFSYVWGAREITTALELAFWVWLGFIATTMLGGFLWEGKSFKLFLLNAGYQFVSIAVMSLIVSLWV
ncbi:MAG TPA: DUF1761 domain-containing protein [Candidatus Paceibacterota bacterium]